MPKIEFGLLGSHTTVSEWLTNNDITNYVITESKANCISIDFQTKFDRDRFVKEYYYKT